MEGKKILLAAGLAALVLFGLVLAVDAARGMRGGKMGGFSGMGFMPCKGGGQGGFMFKGGEGPMNKTIMFENLGLPENASREQMEDALWKKHLENLGLTEGSILSEYRKAVKVQMQEKHEEMLGQVREKLSLPADATEEEVREAMKENKTGCPFMGGRMGSGFRH